MKSLSKRLLDVPASAIRKLVPLAEKAKKDGVKVYHLNIGDPDIETPEVMLDVLRNWTRKTIGYESSLGNKDFIASLLSYYHKLEYTFLDTPHIQVTNGGSEAIWMSLFSVANPSEEIIVFEPFFTTYNSYAVINGVTIKPILTTSDNGYHLPSQEIIEQAITSKTKAILYCSPNNPTGTVYEKSEIEMLVAIAKKHGIFLISDEVYREFAYDGRKQTSLLSYMQEIPEQAILLDSLSKRYSLCGARLGVFISLNQDLMAGVLRMAQARLSSGLVDQAMAAKLTQVPESYFQNVQTEYKARRDVVYEGLKDIPGVKIPKPEGAFYTMVTLPIDDSEKFCRWLLTDFRDKDETVMLAPAPGFYVTKGLGENEVRIAYVLSVPKLSRCIELLTKALKQYQNLSSRPGLERRIT